MKVCVVSYYGLDREPLQTAVQCLTTKNWIVSNYSMYRWKLDSNDATPKYLENAVKEFEKADVVLFWFHALTPTEMKFLRQHCTKPFCLFNWDDPYTWFSPFLQMERTKKYWNGVITCCQEAIPRYDQPKNNIACQYPGFVESLAEQVCAKYVGPNRFVCDVSIMCTNLYDNAELYGHQKINRKELVDALYKSNNFVMHVYGPSFLQEQYPRSYQGLATYEKTYEIVRTSKICISTHVVSQSDITTNYANERTIIVAGCGGLLMTDLVPSGSGAIDLGNNVQEAVDNVLQTLAMSYEMLESKRKHLRQWALQHYTWNDWSTVTSNILHSAILHGIVPTCSESNHVVLPKTRIQDIQIQSILDLCHSKTVCKHLGAFDKAVSIGSWCIGAQQLKRRNWRQESYPFDWTFVSLPFVQKTMIEYNKNLTLDEFMTPSCQRTEQGEDSFYRRICFPHHSCNNLSDIQHYRRAGTRWTDLMAPKSNSNNRNQRILLLHTPRPSENVEILTKQLMEMETVLKSKHHDFYIMSVWHRVFDSTESFQKNKLFCLEQTQTHVVLLAHVSSEWDANHWDAAQHEALWDQVFQCFDQSL